MALANVTLSDTFDQWRIKTNQALYSLNEIDSNANLISAVSNTSSISVTPKFGRGSIIYIAVNLDTSLDNTSTNVIASANSINVLHELHLGGVINTSAAFDKANSANVFVYNLAIAANANLSVATISSNNFAGVMANSVNANLSVVSLASNVYTDIVVTANLVLAKGYTNTYTDTVVTANLATAKSYTDTIILANLAIANAYSRTFANSVGTAANANLSVATIAANNFAGSMANSSNAMTGNAYGKANDAYDLATIAYAATGSGGSLQTYANSIGVNANTYANSVGSAGNTYTNAVGSASNSYTNTVVTSNLASSKSYTDTVVIANTTLAWNKANAANLLAYQSNNYAISTFVNKSGDTISGDLTISGNLTITGITTYVNTSTLMVSDNIFVLNSDLPIGTSPSENAGMEINRGNKNSNAAIIWNETAALWMFSSNTLNNYTTAIASNTSVDNAGTTANSYAGTMVAANLVTAKSYSDTVVTANLASAKGYTNTYTDTVVTANLATAKSYTDTNITSNTNTRLANTSGAVFGGSLIVKGVLTANTGAIRESKVDLATANTVDLSLGNFFTKTITSATTLSVSNVPAANLAASFVFDLTNGGSATITWWTGVKWAGGTAPTLTTSGRDSLGFYTYDGGTTWTGLVLGKDIK